MNMILGTRLPAHLQRQVLGAYVHRFTKEHVPAWARKLRPDGNRYPVQFASDRDWLAHTEFPITRDGRLSLRPGTCQSYPTWPDDPLLRLHPVMVERRPNPGPEPELECPACGGEAQLMGSMGSLNWYRCRQCGMEASVSATPRRQRSRRASGRRSNPGSSYDPAHFGRLLARRTGRKSLREFIREHRQELDKMIQRAAPGASRSDGEREMWIRNHEGLYRWARSEGVRL